nr:tripartite tricarboxylate transporter TctB family protein [uncultured Roseateles sp.]
MQTDDTKSEPAGLATRGPELAVAIFLLLLALLVITDSLRVGIGWADDGPRAGYFPFYIGLLLLASSATVLVSTLLRWKRPSALFAERAQLVTVFAMLLPMSVYVGAVALLGIYEASFLLIGYFMRRHGSFSWLLTGVIAAGVPLAFFLVFERWFLVPLPKGPLEHLLGF